jgi:photosystem II stability/assembly factor-like uncharacterized protein
MRKQIGRLSLVAAAIIGFSFALSSIFTSKRDSYNDDFPRVRSTFSPKASLDKKEGRDLYFFNMLRDPASGKIPENIRSRELRFAENFDSRKRGRAVVSADYDWKEAGPNDVGGRTRAIGIDKRNSNIILAGGVSGGLYRSTDKGTTWTLVNDPNEYNGITSIAQDPRAGEEDVWYYATGEFTGNSATAQGGSASYSGNGLFKSTDNGLSWSLISGTDSDVTKWNKEYDYVSKIMVSPTSGNIFVCANGFGIMKYNVTANTDAISLGGINNHYWADIDIDASGNIIAFLSESRSSSVATPTNSPGIYRSTDDGATWTRIGSDSDMNAQYDRGLIRIAPSNTNVAYLFMVDNKEPYFYKIDIAGGSIIDRTSNVNETYQGYTSGQTKIYERLGKQGAYNMTLAVHPTDENFVIAGSTSLFRSKDGFATKPSVNYTWIGGYGNRISNTFIYPNHHPDCHVTAFSPDNSGAVWSGHDGGLSYAADAKLDTESFFTWTDKNKGYNITQFYTVALPHRPDDQNLFMGGTQDNGSPMFTFNGTATSASSDRSSGDGSFCAFGKDYYYASSQNGTLVRWKGSRYILAHPLGAKQQQLFIHPFEMDENNEKIIYYPARGDLYINPDISKIPEGTASADGTTINWTKINVAPSGYIITALASTTNPANILYVAAYSTSGTPKIYKIESPANSKNRKITELNISGVQGGVYPHDLYVNPLDGNEFIVVFSNYNITGVYHTTDGGASFNAIEGDLTGDASNPGPSIRTAAIVNHGDTKIYYLGTSTGLYKTKTLNGASTAWVKVKSDIIGSVIVNDIDVNPSDGKIAVGTHGRGIFAGSSNYGLYVKKMIDNQYLKVNQKTSVDIDLNGVFGGASSFDIVVDSNSNTDFLTTSISGSTLTVTIKADVEAEGTIVLKATDGGKFVKTSFVVSTVSETDPSPVNTEKSNEFKIYPNPTRGISNIIMENEISENVIIEVINSNGQVILRKETNNYIETIDISNSPTGIYFVKVSNGTKTGISKLIKR